MNNLILIAALFGVLLIVVLWFVCRKPKESFASLQYDLVRNPMREGLMAAMADQAPAPPSKKDLDAMRKRLADWYSQQQSAGKLKPMDKWGRISLEAAIDAASMGNWSIGNVLCYMPPGTEQDPTRWIEILRGGNRFFTRNPKDILATSDFIPRFDSHAHGEMVVLDAFEDRLCRGFYDKSSSNYSMPKDSPIDFRRRNDIVGYGMPDGIVLFTQLNSCQMCLSRIGNSGIARCYWLGADTCGGLAHQLCHSVPCYFNMLNRQVHDVADVSNDLIQFAQDVFLGPNAAWVSYCTWKLGQVGAPSNQKADYGYCKGQYYANNKVGQNTVYDWEGFFRTTDLSKGPYLNCTVKPPTN